MKILALDWGERRVGVAVSDGLGIIARGLEIIDEPDFLVRLKRIKALIEQHEIEEIILGMPFTLKGEIGIEAKKKEILAGKLKKELQISVHLQDERLSTKEIEGMLISFDVSRAKRKKVRDKLAAQLILQTFLDKKTKITTENTEKK